MTATPMVECIVYLRSAGMGEPVRGHFPSERMVLIPAGDGHPLPLLWARDKYLFESHAVRHAPADFKPDNRFFESFYGRHYVSEFVRVAVPLEFVMALDEIASLAERISVVAASAGAFPCAGQLAHVPVAIIRKQ